MGYSCTKAAGDTIDRINQACYAVSGSCNLFGNYFFERGRENPDGAITGTVWKTTKTMLEGTTARRIGSFRIEPNGTFTRGPAFMRRAAEGWYPPNTVEFIPVWLLQASAFYVKSGGRFWTTRGVSRGVVLQ